MKKFICVFIPFALFSFCKDNSERVDIVIENGIEVVLNRLEPYILKHEPSTFSLEKEFEIDFERADLAEEGIGEVQGFEVDSIGCIYCISDSRIFKFGSSGVFILSYGENGQGPGEIQTPLKWWMTASDDLGIYDYGNNKFLFLDNNGVFSKEIKIPSIDIRSFGPNWMVVMDCGNYVLQEASIDRNADKIEHHLAVFGPNFEKFAVLNESVLYENPFQSARFNLIRTHILSCISNDKIYTVCQQNPDFLINIYNQSGDLVKQIRKEYRKAEIPKSVQDRLTDEYMNSMPYRVHKMAGYFPDFYPPVKNISVDDLGRLFVGTYEEGENSDEEMVDLFSSEGVFTGRVSLQKAANRIFKNDRLYWISEKENGYQILSVHKLLWNK